jgi:hypothetical protein
VDKKVRRGLGVVVCRDRRVTVQRGIAVVRNDMDVCE